METSSKQQQTIEYKFLRQNRPHAIPKMRFSASVYLAVFHISIIVLFGFFSVYQTDSKTDATTRLYSSEFARPLFLLLKANLN
jgi:hypothetical protein